MALAVESHKWPSQEITALFPYSPADDCRTGGHPGKTWRASGDDVVFNPFHKWFQAEPVAFDDVRSLYQVLASRADEGLSFVMRAVPAHNGRFIRRSKSVIGGCPAGLRATSTTALPLDCDSWPNIWSMDPRTMQMDAVVENLMEAMPAEVRNATMGIFLSSSCCVRAPDGQAPDTISFRAWACMDVELGEKEAKELVRRIDAHVRGFFRSEGVDLPKGHLVDPKVLETQQPIYLATPRFEGMADPLARRHMLREGTRETVDVASLLATLPHPEKKTRDASPKAPRTPKLPAVVRARSSRATTEPRAPQVVPLAVARRLRDAKNRMLDAVDLDDFGYRAACITLFYARAPLELVDLVLDCRRLAEEGDAEYAEWIDGIPEGRRCQMMVPFASCIAASLPLTTTVAQLRAEIESWARLVVDEAWFADEWVRGGFDASLVSHFEAAQRGEHKEIGGEVRDARYWYSQRRVAEEFGATEDQVVRLKLKSIASRAHQHAAYRAAKGIPTRARHLASVSEVANADAPRVQAMAASGMSVRQIAAETGYGKDKVARLLKLEAPAQETVVAVQEPVLVSQEPVAVVQASVAPVVHEVPVAPAAEVPVHFLDMVPVLPVHHEPMAMQPARPSGKYSELPERQVVMRGGLLHVLKFGDAGYVESAEELSFEDWLDSGCEDADMGESERLAA